MRNLVSCSLCLLTILLAVSPCTSLAAEDWTGEWLFRAAPEGCQPLRTSQKAWFHPERKVVIVDGEVCMRRGQLEMFACPRNTKEYESVVAVDALPGIIHGGLKKVGAKPGSPATFDPYKPATGTPIEVIVVWADKAGKRHAKRAQEWIKDVNTGKPMERSWVFAGSQFVKDVDNDRIMYRADEGDFICVANFSTASIDLPVKSPQDNASLAYEAFTEHIPPEKTKVRLVLVPQLDSATKAD